MVTGMKYMSYISDSSSIHSLLLCSLCVMYYIYR